jgi:hypothetical protein
MASPKPKKVDVKYRREAGAWNAYAAKPDCRAWGRSISEARTNLIRALTARGVRVDEVIDDIQLPLALQKACDRYKKLDAEATAEIERVKVRAREAKGKLVQVLAAELSLRDIGELLGLSQEGVRKILTKRSSGSSQVDE